jgi:hypothetical protein
MSQAADRLENAAHGMAWAYSQHSRRYVQQSDHVIYSESGVCQGDPLGMLLFALTL